MSAISVPTTAALFPSQRLPSTDHFVIKVLNRLSRASLVSLILDWLDDRNQELCSPYLVEDEEAGDDEDDAQVHLPARYLHELREHYLKVQYQKGSKREVIYRILEGDWRHGISLYQLAMADMQHFYDCPMSLKWTAMEVLRRSTTTQDSTTELSCIPRFHPPTFLQNLQMEVLPDVKAHYHLDSHPELSITILRICFFPSPYNTSLALTSSYTLDTTQTVLIAFPNASPYVFISTPQHSGEKAPSRRTDTTNVRAFLQDAIPKAFSRPHERYILRSTALSAKTLESLLEKKGAGRGNFAKGGWSVYSEGKDKDDKRVADTPLDLIPSTTVLARNTQAVRAEDEISDLEIAATSKRKRSDYDTALHKKRMATAETRFGPSAQPEDKTGIESLAISMRDIFPNIALLLEPITFRPESTRPSSPHDGQANPALLSKPRSHRSDIEIELDEAHDAQNNHQSDNVIQSWTPDIRLTISGNHIFAGIRALIECGAIDGEKMPAWMTGEEGVSLGIVRNGRVVGFKGSGV